MKALSTAIFSKAANTDFLNLIGGRLYEETAEPGAQFPYCVYYILDCTPEYPGGSIMEKVLIQFSIFSSSASSVEIMDILTKLQAVYDDCSLSPTNETLIYFIRGAMTTNIETVESTEGTGLMRHYAQEYSLEILRT